MQSVAFTNLSGAPAALGTVKLTGPYPDFAVVSDNCSGSTIPAGGNCTISIGFTASVTSTQYATLTLNTNPASFPMTVYISGSGLPIGGTLGTSSTTLNFPDTPARTISAPQTLTVSNRGAVPFSVLVSNYSSAFGMVNNCLSPIAAGGSCTIVVTFRPWSVQSFAGEISIIPVGGIAANGTSVNLTGNGIAAPAATLCPTTVSFGNQNVGAATAPSAISLNNTGSGNLTVTQITISGDFAQTNTCGGPGASLPALTACTINVTFTPTTTGVRNGTLTITDNSAGSPHTVSLTGTGVTTSTALPPTMAPLTSLPLGPAQPAAGLSTGEANARARELAKKAYAQLPLSFEANRGQFDPKVKFLSRGSGYTLFLTGDEAVLTLKSSVVSGQLSVSAPLAPTFRSASAGLKSGATRSIDDPATNHGPRTTDTVLHMKLVGANAHAEVAGADELPGKSNYFQGRDAQNWHTHIPNYARVRYQSVYPGVDLVYYGHDRQLEYDFVLAPGADPAAIRFALGGAQEVGRRQSAVGSGDQNPTARQSKIQNLKSKIDPNGDLVVTTDGGEVRFHKPVVYQPAIRTAQRTTDYGQRTLIDGHYVLQANNQVGFKVASYDHTRPLIIDPTLTYSTYLGGSSWDGASGIAVDAAGDAYIVGGTGSADFPTANPLQPALNQNRPYASDAFITKLSADGSSFLFSTFLGGSDEDSGVAIALDSSGNAYIVGSTESTDFPITSGAFQTVVSNGNSAYHAHGFVTKLSADGSTLLYSTYLGGSAEDGPYGIGVDASGNAYVTGGTTSPDFPTTPSAVQKVFTASTANCSLLLCGSGFVTALNAQGSALLYSTFLSGTGSDLPQAIAVDAAGNAYVAGVSGSLDFPTTPGALQSGPASSTESFAAKFSPQGQLVYSTYLAGVGASAIAVDAKGAVYLAGQGNPGFNPTTTSAQFGPVPQNSSSGTVAKLHPAGCGLVYSAFLGGFRGAFGNAIAVDPSGAVFVAGGTTSADFPTVNPVQASCHDCDSVNSSSGPFISKLDPTGKTLVYSTYLGGSKNPTHLCCDSVTGIALDAAGNAYVAGHTLTTDFPTVNAIQPLFGGGQTDAFVAKFNPAIVPSLSISPGNLSFSTQVEGTTSAPQTVTVTNQATNRVNISSIGINDINPQFSETNTCGTGLGPSASCIITITFTPTGGAPSEILTINDDAYGGPHVVGLTGTAITGPSLFIPNLIGGNSIIFSDTPMGTTVGPEPLSVENLGQSPLTISSIVATGDFSQTNNCNASIAPQGSCSLSVSFKPTAGGTRTGTLTLTDNAPGSPQVISLSGGSMDFSLATTASPSSVKAGQSATYAITLTPIAGFNSQISLACSGAPLYATCSLPSGTVTLDGNNTPTVTITVTTTAPSFLPPARHFSPTRWTPLLLLTFLSMLIFLALMAASERCAKWLTPLAAALLLTALWAGCGGGSGGGGGGGGGGYPGTPAGTYTLTVTGTSGSLSHTLNLTLTVN